MIKVFEDKLEDGLVVSTVVAVIIPLPSRAIAMLGDVETLQEYQSQGRATKLLKEAIEWCKTQDVDHIQLNCREGLQSFYENVGFVDASNIKMIYKIK